MPDHPFVKTDKAVIMGWETDRFRLCRGLGDAKTPARRSSTPWSAARPTRPPARACWSASSAATTSIAADANTRSPAVIGYTRGRADGRRSRAAPAGKAPTFLVAALKDPIGANLDRYQIVKGWVDAKGEMQEKVYDVAWSGDRKPGADGKVPPVGSTVDVANATWTNTIGAPELIAVWNDPDFDPAQRAFYYGRVLEIPTPRWTAYDAKYFNVKMGPEVTDADAGARLHVTHLVHAVEIAAAGNSRSHTSPPVMLSRPVHCSEQSIRSLSIKAHGPSATQCRRC